MSAVGNDNSQTYQLEANLPDWCILKWHHALVCGLFVACFLYTSYLPIPALGVWENVWLGGWISQHGIPTVDPSLPLAENVRQSSTGWLSNLLSFWLHQSGGAFGLINGYAVLLISIFSIVAWTGVRATGRWWFAIISVVACALTTLTNNGLQPQIWSGICFAILTLIWYRGTNPDSKLVIGNCQQDSREVWICYASLFVLWANLHWSFLIGLAWLTCLICGNLIDMLRNRSRLTQADFDEVNNQFFFIELMALCTLLNPVGWNVWKAILWWPDNPVIESLGGWNPLNLITFSGLALVLGWTCWGIASRQCERIPASSVLLAIFATGLISCFSLAIFWFAILMLLAIMPLYRPLPNVDTEASKENTEQPLRFAFTLICGLLIWIGFSLSPISTPILGATSATLEREINQANGVSNFLQDRHSAGLVFAPQYWADQLQSPEKVIPVFANGNAHLLPELARHDYASVYRGESNWAKTLDRYDVDYLIVDRERQPELLKRLRVNSAGWEKVYDDKNCVLVQRGSKQ